MASTNAHQIKNNDQNSLCGLGDKIRRLTAGVCLFTQIFFPVMATAQNVVHAKPQTTVSSAPPLIENNTVPYTLGALESAQSVADRFGISLEELRRLNQFRTFARGFDNVRQGEELDVPATTSQKSHEQQNAIPPANGENTLENQIASTSQRVGTLLSQDMNSEQASGMARGWASSEASGAMTDWLNNFGTAKISLGVDEDFSLKNSQFDFLHPWYDTPDYLLFSQHTLHRTDDRTQINTGLGWRHFTSSWMSGINLFFDHDLSRYHSRAGLGAEYWRDYLKLSSNAYIGLTGWRSAPELDYDFEARPANGWDLRAEGWLPAWPQLGGKLVYEQYYGDEVALFDKNDRQSNPHAITAGLNYTPFPLLTLSAEQRQGKQGENDTRFAVDLTWQPSSSMQKQLNPDEVAGRRSLAGSRYDLIDRNNNIVLEYRKKELIRLSLLDPVKGKSGEIKPLVSSLQTKYALKGYNIEAAALEAAGGKVSTSGKDITVTLPGYRFTNTPETDNTWSIDVTAEDVKGNLSRHEQSMVVIQAPTLSQKDSLLSVNPLTVAADKKSTTILIVTAHDSDGTPVPGLALQTRSEGVQDITLSDWTDNGDGSYTQILTAGTTSGSVTLTPQINGESAVKESIVVNIVPVVSSRDHSSITIDNVSYYAGDDIKVRVELKDDSNQPVAYQKEELVKAVTVENSKPGTTIVWHEEQPGVYTANYPAHKQGTALRAQLSLHNWNAPLQSHIYNIEANQNKARVATLSATNNDVYADKKTFNTLTINVTDESDNPLTNHQVTFKNEKGSAEFVEPPQQNTDAYGVATINMVSQVAEENTISATLPNGFSQRIIAKFVSDSSTPKFKQLVADPDTIIAGNSQGSTLTATVTDFHNNPLKDMKVNFVAPGGSQLDNTSATTDQSGIVRVHLTSSKVGSYSVDASLEADKNIHQSVTITVVPNREQSVMTLNAGSGSAIANNTNIVTLTASVKDVYGHPLPDEDVKFTLPASMTGNFTLSSETARTDANGDAVVTLRGTKAGEFTVTATLTRNNTVAYQQVTFIGDTNSAQLQPLTASLNSIVAGNSTGSTLTATILDAYQNPLKDQLVTFQSNDVTLSGTEVTTNTLGQATVTMTSNIAGQHNVVVSRKAQASDNKTFSLSVLPDESSAKVISITGAEKTITVGENITLRILVQDAFNNVIAGQRVRLSAQPTTNITIGDTAYTDNNGYAYVNLLSTQPGVYQVTATLDNNSSSKVDVNVANGKLELTSSKPETTVHNSEGITLTATARNARGELMPGQIITFSVTPEGATLSNTGEVLTDQSGQAKVTLTSDKVNVYTVTAIMGKDVPVQSQVTVAVKADAKTAHVVSVVASPDTITADGIDSSTITSRVEDDYGFPVEGVDVSHGLDTKGSPVVNIPTTRTDQSGQVTATITSTLAETLTVNVQVPGTANQSATITLVAGTADESKSILKSDVDTLKADYQQSAKLTLTLQDKYGNPIVTSDHLEFVQSGPFVNFLKLSDIDYSQRNYGEYTVTVTGGKEGTATLIPMLNGVHQANLSISLNLIRSIKEMSGHVTANNHTFSTAKFPSEGFAGAYYTLNNDNFEAGKTVDDYMFSSSQSWVSVDASGKVSFANIGDQTSVTISAVPRQGGTTYQTLIKLKGWWVNNGNHTNIWLAANALCHAKNDGYNLPGITHLTSGENKRTQGSLYGEWGNVGAFSSNSQFTPGAYWTSESDDYSRHYYVQMLTGMTGSDADSSPQLTACRKSL
ncbi:TPA: inverse autotransporter beta-barrel domain-containing protein [Escherichia coli]|uniref:inverse autotransporter IatD n=1 Tax=Escherichia coli TaxID=562 RepID=UPI0006A5F58B|nr:inverse autotransporter IatD [Escherichia coli]EFS2097482.1 inverse autotransporter beta-barrel domain-containing protein [Escherichia coli]EFU6057441.1 inverse autotransporter beta-barrel domain-containing protein [Escherichia coli]EGH1331721.1 inverse autotransporter beta-barrel domain-containing protein [Escherichia coli]EGH1368786.1 inverse autotransporter beta-barrel domain-containing protein [Escherichia coli]EHB8441925.1 inverse autotransporter beta-barrel domain-containing protein [